MARIEVKINGVITLVDVNELEKLENGLFANNYNKDGTIDTVGEQQEILEQELQAKINEAKQYLQSTDYKMTVDYFATLLKEEQDDLIAKRAEAREFIRSQA